MLQLIQTNDRSSPWGCSWVTAPSGDWLLFDKEKRDVLMSFYSVVLSFSRTLFFLPLPPFILWRPGPSGPAVLLSVCTERAGDGRFDSHTEV